MSEDMKFEILWAFVIVFCVGMFCMTVNSCVTQPESKCQRQVK